MLTELNVFYAGRVWQKVYGIRPSVQSFFLTLIGRAAYTQHDSPGRSTLRGQHTLLSEYWEDGHTCFEYMQGSRIIFCYVGGHSIRLRQLELCAYCFYTADKDDLSCL